MSLTQDQIKALLAKPEKKPRSKTPTGVDTSVRDYFTWFKLTHRLGDEEPFFCDNPNCDDPRPHERGQVVAEVNGQMICRICFLSGYASKSPSQLSTDGIKNDAN